MILQCQLYGGGICRTPATHQLRAPDGDLILAPLCLVHAEEHVREYREKLDEEHVLEPIPGAAAPKRDET